jgi:hypothetical protein
LNIAVVLNSHENSPVFRDTLDSVLCNWTDRVIVVVDAKNWGQFERERNIVKLEGFYHAKESAPYRNVCLGLMKCWEVWSGSVDWVCYMEYDCLVGSAEIAVHLEAASRDGTWILGNDHRVDPRSIPFLERFKGRSMELHYLLGCCLFLSRDFMARLRSDNFFERFLQFTNFHINDPVLVSCSGREEKVYDISEFIYPTLACDYGGSVRELACWEDGRWRGSGDLYPMRFRPELHESCFENACIMHPLKGLDDPARKFHRSRRNLDAGRSLG